MKNKAKEEEEEKEKEEIKIQSCRTRAILPWVLFFFFLSFIHSSFLLLHGLFICITNSCKENRTCLPVNVAEERVLLDLVHAVAA